MRNIKCVAVGDTGVGKTSIFWTYVTKEFPKNMPAIQDHSLFITRDDIVYNLGLFDVSGNTEDKLRPLMYPGSDVVLVCFDVTSPGSLENVKSRWVPEVQANCPGVPFLLVGTKSDLRTEEYKGSDDDFSSWHTDLAKILGAVAYLECSALRQEGIQEVINSAVDTVIAVKSKKRKNNCSIV